MHSLTTEACRSSSERYGAEPRSVAAEIYVTVLDIIPGLLMTYLNDDIERHDVTTTDMVHTHTLN